MHACATIAVYTPETNTPSFLFSEAEVQCCLQAFSVTHTHALYKYTWRLARGECRLHQLLNKTLKLGKTFERSDVLCMNNVICVYLQKKFQRGNVQVL